jgi:hypothetical protein
VDFAPRCALSRINRLGELDAVLKVKVEEKRLVTNCDGF